MFDFKKVLLGIAITIGLLVLIWGFTVSGGKITKVIVHNIGFWIVLFIAFVFGIIRKLTNPKEFTWIELPVQLFVSFVVIVALYALFFSVSANLTDREIWNGYVTRAEYYEEWTELVVYVDMESAGTDADGNTIYVPVVKTRHDYHPPEWRILTTLCNLGIDKKTYQNYVRHFGNEKKKDLSRAGQVSSGDGNMHFVQLRGNQRPASQERSFVNYLRASDSIKKVSGFISTYKEFLRPYPRVYKGDFGPIEVDRVINAGANFPPEWMKTVDKELDLALAFLGSKKRANILVYVVGVADQGFSHALEEFWVKGKKNDIVIIIGATGFPKIDFVYIMAWTKIEEFKIELRNRLLDLKDLSDGKKVADLIISQVSKPPQEGGFEKMSMAELEYLIADIKLPLWCQILIILIGGGACWLTSFFLIRNEVREDY